MNKRTVRLLTEGIIAGIFSVLWRLIEIETQTSEFGITISLSILPFIWLGLRHGVAVPIFFATLTGLCNSIIFNNQLPIVERLLIELTPLLSGGLAGLFAKYTQKTLNNRRLASTRLNIITASLVSLLCYYVIRYAIGPFVTSIKLQPNILSFNLWGGWGVTVIISATLLILFAYFKPNLLIPKRSKYLSRKETSRLLND